MPRRRTLSPEFFKDEDLATLPFEARLLYAGLWCYADKSGRLEDRHKYLKAEIFPYDRVDVDKLLSRLACPQIPDRPGKVFIRRYAVDGKQLIDIPEFMKHQSPHHTEHDSRLPEFNGDLTVNERLVNSEVQDAHYPISDPISDPIQRPEPPHSGVRWGTPEALMALYNEECPSECPAAEHLSPKRKEKAARLLKAFPDKAYWQEAFREVHKSPFLRGMCAPGKGHSKAFVASFDWFLSTSKDGIENVVQVWERKYGNQT